MIIKEQFYGVKCDVCKKIAEGDDTDIAFFADKNDAKENAMNNEWYQGEEGDFCPNCHEIDDEDKLIIHSKNQ
jgi:hypothetical protein